MTFLFKTFDYVPVYSFIGTRTVAKFNGDLTVLHRYKKRACYLSLETTLISGNLPFGERKILSNSRLGVKDTMVITGHK
jgi:hypothetical protein